MTTKTPIKSRCAECGLLMEAGTFHPAAFCSLAKDGDRDPWQTLRWMMERITGTPGGGLPHAAPFIRNLPLPPTNESRGSDGS